MTQEQWILWWWLLITIFGYIVYIYGMVIGHNKPHPFSRIIRCAMTTIATLAQLTETQSLSIWIGICTIIIQIIIIILSYTTYYHSRHISSYDRYAAFLWSIAILAWVLSWSPLWSVYFLCIADAIGFIPTIRKTRYHPQQEYLWVYLTSVIKRSISVYLLDIHTIITTLYPMYLVVANGLFLIYTLSLRYYRSRFS